MNHAESRSVIFDSEPPRKTVRIVSSNKKIPFEDFLFYKIL